MILSSIKDITRLSWDMILMPDTVIGRFGILGKIWTRAIEIYLLQGLTHWRWWCWAYMSGWVWIWKWSPIKNWIWKSSWLSRWSRGGISQAGLPNHSTTRQSIIGSLIRRNHQNITSAGNHITPHSPVHETITPKGNPRSVQVFNIKVTLKNKIIHPAWQALSMPLLCPSCKTSGHSIRIDIFSPSKCNRNGHHDRL